MKYELKIITSGKCNLGCCYCYERSIRELIPSEIAPTTIDGLKRMILNDSNNIQSISFMGGETLLSISDIITVLSHVKSVIIEENIDIYLFTNGTIFNNKIIEFYKFINDIKTVHVILTDHNLSLRMTNDNIMFKHIKFLKDNYINFKLKVLVDRERIVHPQSITEYFTLNHLDIDLVLAYYDKFNPITQGDFDKFILYLKSNLHNIPYKLLKGLLYLFKCYRIINNEPLNQCGSGVVELAVTGDGRIHGCENILYAADADISNIRSISSINELYQTSNTFQLLKSKYDSRDDKCINCIYSSVCTQCRYNHTTNLTINSDKSIEICSFSELIFYNSIQIGLIISRYLININFRKSLQQLKILKESI